jgi:hypothetical protein
VSGRFTRVAIITSCSGLRERTCMRTSPDATKGMAVSVLTCAMRCIHIEAQGVRHTVILVVHQAFGFQRLQQPFDGRAVDAGGLGQPVQGQQQPRDELRHHGHRKPVIQGEQTLQ